MILSTSLPSAMLILSWFDFPGVINMGQHRNLLAWCLGSLQLVLYATAESQMDNTACPNKTDEFIRLGQTRFYIIQLENKRGKYVVDWDGAKDQCAKAGMKLAKIDKMTTLSVVGRALEKLATDKNLKDTWYWLDAKFEGENYFWQESKSELKLGTYFYRQPRPTGVGAYFSWDGKYQKDKNISHCLTIALPWPGAKDQMEKMRAMFYGHETSFEESPCSRKSKRHAMCESKNVECRLKNVDPFELTEDKDQYFYDGNWIIGDRKYIVNWEPKTYEDSTNYCTKLGLQLYSPKSANDTCLVPFLKMWSRRVTVSHFWTNWKYNISGGYMDDKGMNVASIAHPQRVNFSELEVSGRSSKDDKMFCVAAALNYEFKDQIPCVSKPCNGNWNFMVFVPANCKNYLATICQHKDFASRKCGFDKNWIKLVNDGLNLTATVPCLEKPEDSPRQSPDFRRSRYKQTFGSLICPTGFRMMHYNNTKWPSANIIGYDKNETYWVVDNGGFNKNLNSNCTTIKDTKLSETVPCSEWHFYLCEKTNKRYRKSNVSINKPKATWDSSIQPREYPILK